MIEKLKIFGGILAVLLYLGFAIKPISATPDYAKIYVDDIHKIYFAPPYIVNNNIETKNLRLTTIGEIRNKNYNPDLKCRDQDYFVYEYRSAITFFLSEILEKKGLISPPITRWFPNGDWLY